MNNIINRDFFDLPTKNQIEFNRQKNVEQDQRIFSAENQITQILNNINLAPEVTSFLPLVWTRYPSENTWRVSAVVNDPTIMVGTLALLFPQGASVSSYISAIVEKTNVGWTVLIAGDFPGELTSLTAQDLITGVSYPNPVTVTTTQTVASNLAEINATDTPNARVKVMSDTDGQTREYVSVDLNADGTFNWVRYGASDAGTDGRSVWAVNSVNISNVLSVAAGNDVFVSADTFTITLSGITVNNGDVGVFRPDLGLDQVQIIGNIRGQVGATGGTGPAGAQGIPGPIYLPTTYAISSVQPALNSTQTVTWGQFFGANSPIPTQPGGVALVFTSAGQQIACVDITQVPPTTGANQVTVTFRAFMAYTGPAGTAGTPGTAGVGISSVTSSRSGSVTTVTVTLTNATVTNFNINDGQDSLPFVIAQGVFTTSTVPSFANAQANTGYIVLNTTPPTNTYDLWIKSGSASDWTVVSDWGGLPGLPGTNALTYGNIIAVNGASMPGTLTATAATFSRTPAVGDQCSFVVTLTNAGVTNTAMAVGTIATVSGGNATVTVTGSSVIPNGINGLNAVAIDLGTVNSFPTLTAVPFTTGQVSPSGTVLTVGQKVFCTMYVNVSGSETLYVGYGTVAGSTTVNMSTITGLAPGVIANNAVSGVYQAMNLNITGTGFTAPTMPTWALAGTVQFTSQQTGMSSTGSMNITNSTDSQVWSLRTINVDTLAIITGQTLQASTVFPVQIDYAAKVIRIPLKIVTSPIPAYSSGNANMVLAVNGSGSGLQWVSIQQLLDLIPEV